MEKMQGPVRTVVRWYGSENCDWFLRFGRFRFVSAFPMNFGQYTSMKLWSDLEEMKEHEEEQRSDLNKGILRKKKKKRTREEEEDKFLKKKKKKKKTCFIP